MKTGEIGRLPATTRAQPRRGDPRARRRRRPRVACHSRPRTARPGPPGRGRFEGRVARSVQGYRKVAADPAGTWQVLAELHDRGRLDVCAAPSRKLVTGIRPHQRGPAGFTATVSGKAARAAAEIGHLIASSPTATSAPTASSPTISASRRARGCCTTAENRCSACWDFADTWPATETKPAVARGLQTRPRPAGGRIDAAQGQRQLDERVRKLVNQCSEGFTAGHRASAARRRLPLGPARSPRRYLPRPRRPVGSSAPTRRRRSRCPDQPGPARSRRAVVAMAAGSAKLTTSSGRQLARSCCAGAAGAAP